MGEKVSSEAELQRQTGGGGGGGGGGIVRSPPCMATRPCNT